MKTALTVLLLILTISAKTGFPKIGNYFLDPSVKMSEADSLARCDFLVLDHEVSRQNPGIIDSIRKLNPSIQILAYMVSEEIETDAAQWKGSLRSSMISQIQENWWLKNSKGEFISFWPGTRMLNIAAGQPEISSIKWNRYLAGIISDSILNDSRWDGIYIDNCWSTVSWVDSLIDYNRDGKPDDPETVDSLWHSGMELMLELIRMENPGKIIVGNGAYRYGKYVNGALFEDFPLWGGWWRLFDTYMNLEKKGVQPTYNFINGTTSNSGKIDLKEMRFGLVNALMGNGCFSFDYGADDHSQHWWFDEYGADLGMPTGPAELHGISETAANHFENGLGGWKAENWKMTTAVKLNAEWNSSAFFANISGEEQWNELISSPELAVGEGSLLKCTVRCRVEKADSGAELFVNLRKGSDYDSDIDVGTVPVSAGIDTVYTFYTDSLFTGSGYHMIVGFKEGGSVWIDDVTLESSENCTVTRPFEKGIAVLNPSPKSQSFSFPGFHKMKGTQDPVHNDGGSADNFSLTAGDGIILLKGVVSVKERLSAGTMKIWQEKSVLLFSGSTEKTKITIFDMKGRRIITDSFEGRSGMLPLEKLASGIYTVTAESKYQTVTGRIIR